MAEIYLIDWHAARIVLVIALGIDQFGGDIVPAASVRAGGSGRWRKVMALEVNVREWLLEAR